MFTEPPRRQAQYQFPLNKAWSDSVTEAAMNVFNIPSTRSSRGISHPQQYNTTATTTNDANTEIEDHDEVESPKNKRPRVEAYEVAESGVASAESATGSTFCLASLLLAIESGGIPSIQTSKDFGICNNNHPQNNHIDSEPPKEAVQRRILLLQSRVNEREDNWRNVIAGCDSTNVCTKTEIYEIRQRAAFLCYAYQLALSKMNEWTWQECCAEACKLLKSLLGDEASKLL